MLNMHDNGHNRNETTLHKLPYCKSITTDLILMKYWTQEKKFISIYERTFRIYS